MSRDSAAENNQGIPRSNGNDNNLAEDGKEVSAAVDPRQAQMNDLIKRRREEKAREAEQAGVELAEPDPKPISNDDGQPSDGEGDGRAAGDGGDGQQEKIYRLKVDGEEVEKPESWMVANSQKLLAGDKRLAQAAQEERRLSEWEQNLRQRESALTQEQSKPPENAGASDDVMAGISDALEGIYSGDDERAKKALANLLGRQQPTQAISQEEIDRRAREAAASTVTELEQMRTIKDAVGKFQTEFNDIASDPFLSDLADRFSAELLDEQPDLEPYQNLKLAGQKAREWLNSRGAGSAGTSDRTQRKRQAMGTVAGANRAMSLGKDEPPAKTRRDVLGDMKRARGQQI